MVEAFVVLFTVGVKYFGPAVGDQLGYGSQVTLHLQPRYKAWPNYGCRVITFSSYII